MDFYCLIYDYLAHIVSLYSECLCILLWPLLLLLNQELNQVCHCILLHPHVFQVLLGYRLLVLPQFHKLSEIGVQIHSWDHMWILPYTSYEM